MKTSRALAASALAFSLCALPSVARATDPAVADARPSALDLTWTSPPGCPVTADVLTRIDALLAPRTTRDFATPITARALITERTPTSFDLTLDTHQSTQHFTRTLQAPSCLDLTDAAALVLALALDPDLAQRRSAPPPDPAPVPVPAPPTPSPPAVPAPVPASRPSSAPSSHSPSLSPSPKSWHLSLSAALDLGTTSPVALGPTASLSFSAPALELALDALWLPPRRSAIPSDPTKGGDLQLFALAPRACFVPLQRRFAAGVCASFEAGQLSGRGFGTANDSTRGTWWAAAGPALFGRYFVLPRLGLVARAQALLPLQEVEFTLENIGVAYRVPAVIERFALGLEAHFD